MELLRAADGETGCSILCSSSLTLEFRVCGIDFVFIALSNLNGFSIFDAGRSPDFDALKLLRMLAAGLLGIAFFRGAAGFFPFTFATGFLTCFFGTMAVTIVLGFFLLSTGARSGLGAGVGTPLARSRNLFFDGELWMITCTLLAALILWTSSAETST